jgi:hypothetical protein
MLPSALLMSFAARSGRSSPGLRLRLWAMEPSHERAKH